ncbi:hypothetical protein EVG20_g5701 [Dentipellis fragilis]|uniref:Uncharacterized protein n=1 Tax=Dentipellis fragilis TaxID=205917 RepID=A0A4Y9YVG5_9AGAM|nr:hypothetical protein EVG20_g5701 [Dentipellis fragilis]
MASGVVLTRCSLASVACGHFVVSRSSTFLLELIVDAQMHTAHMPITGNTLNVVHSEHHHWENVPHSVNHGEPNSSAQPPLTNNTYTTRPGINSNSLCDCCPRPQHPHVGQNLQSAPVHTQPVVEVAEWSSVITNSYQPVTTMRFQSAASLTLARWECGGDFDTNKEVVVILRFKASST